MVWKNFENIFPCIILSLLNILYRMTSSKYFQKILLSKLIWILTRGSSGCLLRPTTLTASILSLVGIVSNDGSGFDGGASFLSTTASWVSRSAFRCELLNNRTSSRAFSSLEERSAWHTSSTMSQTDEHTGSTWSGGSSRRSWTCNSHDGRVKLSWELVFVPALFD